MGSSYARLGLAALGLGLVACAFDWDGVYGARFGGDAQGRGGDPFAEYGGASSTGGTSDSAGTSSTGGTPSTDAAGGSVAGAAGCSGNLLANPGFELADRKGLPTGWEHLSGTTSDGSVAEVATPPYEGAYSLLVDTTNLKGNPPADYVLVLASTQVFDVAGLSRLYLSAVAEVSDQSAPIWVAVLYFDSGGLMLGDFSAGSASAADHLEFTQSSGFVAEGPLASSVRPLAAAARVAIVARPGVSAYVDSVCLTW